jgi:hypothetical protein
VKLSELLARAKEEFTCHVIKGCPFDGTVPTVSVGLSQGSYRPEMLCLKCHLRHHGEATLLSDFGCALEAVENIKNCIRKMIQVWNQRME